METRKQKIEKYLTNAEIDSVLQKVPGYPPEYLDGKYARVFCVCSTTSIIECIAKLSWSKGTTNPAWYWFRCADQEKHPATTSMPSGDLANGVLPLDYSTTYVCNHAVEGITGLDDEIEEELAPVGRALRPKLDRPLYHELIHEGKEMETLLTQKTPEEKEIPLRQTPEESFEHNYERTVALWEEEEAKRLEEKAKLQEQLTEYEQAEVQDIRRRIKDTKRNPFSSGVVNAVYPFLP